MPLLLVAAAIAAPPAAVPKDPAPCEQVRTSLAGAAADAPSVRPLAQMPPGKLILGVLNREGGCVRPIVVRDVVGSPGTPDAPRR